MNANLMTFMIFVALDRDDVINLLSLKQLLKNFQFIRYIYYEALKSNTEG